MKLSRSGSWLALTLLAIGAITCSTEPRPEAAAIKAVAGDTQTAPVGAVLPISLVVLVTDGDGKPVPDVVVHWEAQGGGSVSSTSVETDRDGHASVQRTLGSTIGDVTTIATVTGLAGSPVTFTATASPAGSESMALATVPPTSVLDKEVFAPDQQPAIKILDAEGQPAVGREVAVSIISGSGAVLEGQKKDTTNAQGIATFEDLGISGIGTQKLQFASGALSVESAAITVAALPSEATTGKWGPPISWPIVPLHIHLLPNGNVLAWGRADQPWVWTPPVDDNPAGAGSFDEVPVPDMLFCSGHAFMPDGRLLVSGGHHADDRGLRTTYLFTASGSSGSWSNANGALMAKGRWYPTVTILPDGRALTMAGRDIDSKVVGISEIWNGTSWQPLSGAPLNFPYYPRNFVASDGRVFYAGEQRKSWWLNVAGSGSWDDGPLHVWEFNRDYGSAVMYDDDKIMYVGGGGDRTSNSSQAQNNPKSSVPTRSAEIIDLGDPSPTWQYTDSMEFRRRHHTATVLPNRNVLVTGGVASGSATADGQTTTGLNNLSEPTRAAEIWDPATTQWRTLASGQVVRGYHAVSILMPNGLVLHGASGDANMPNPTNPDEPGPEYPREESHEMFSPPYLFQGNRPTITSAPPSVGYGDQFTVETPYGAQITLVTWIRLPSVTHAFDSNQRLNTLTFQAAPDGQSLTVSAPSSGRVAPPGHYMLFIMNRNGVPSGGRIIRIG